MHRRKFLLQSLGMAGALPFAGGATAAAGRGDAQSSASDPLHVLVDMRHAASRRFGTAAAARGARVSRYDGDLTALWQHTLRAQWRAQRGRMAGIATERGWLVLAQLAGEHRWVATINHNVGQGLVAWTLAPGARA